MLEILLVYFLCKKLGTIARDKGRRAGGYQAMLIGMWIGGEFFGGFLGVMMADGEVTAAAYGMALLGAAVGAIGAFVIVSTLKSVIKPHPYTGGFPVIRQ
jgi:hypothetical protein